jgi:amino acid transporter
MDGNKKLGLPSAVATVVGLIVATSCLLTLGSGVGMAGNWYIIAMAVIVVYNLLMVISFRELQWMMPGLDGALGQYTKIGMGPVFSIISNGSTYFIAMILAMSVELDMAGMVINMIFLPSVPSSAITLVFIIALVIINFLGVDIFAKVQNVVVTLLIGSLLVMGVLSSLRLGTGTLVDKALQGPPSVTGIGAAIGLSALAFWLFIGIEFVIPVSPYVKNPKRNIGLSMVVGLIVIFAFNAILANGIGNYVPYEDLLGSDLPHMVFAERFLGRGGMIWMGIVTVLASISSGNTVFAASPAILAGMSKNGMLPLILSKKNKYNVPYIGLFIMAGIVAVICVTGFSASSGLLNMLLAATCFWITTYILICITTMILRVRYPNHPGRNKKLVWFNIPQIVCIIIGFYMIWNIAEGDARILIFKIFGIFGACLVAFALIWVGAIKKQPLFRGDTIDDAMYNENIARGKVELPAK